MVSEIVDTFVQKLSYAAALRRIEVVAEYVRVTSISRSRPGSLPEGDRIRLTEMQN